MSNGKYPNIPRMIDDALAAEGDLAAVTQVVPILWPILEVAHNIELRITEPIAVAERFVLEAVARFGPLPVDEVAEMMGLAPDVVLHLVEKVSRFPDVVHVVGNVLSAPANLLERLDLGAWTDKPVQPFSFWVNGPTGRLLPKTCVTDEPSTVGMDYESGLPKSSSGQRGLDTLYWIAPLQSNGIGHLRELIDRGDGAMREEFGVPAGASAVAPGSDGIVRTRWEIAIGMFFRDEKMTVRLARRPEVVLVEMFGSGIQPFASLLRRKEKTFYYKGAAESIKTEDAISASWKDFAEFKFLPEGLCIRLHPAIASDPMIASQLLFDDIVVSRPDLPQRLPFELLRLLGRAYYWNPFHFFVRPIAPGNEETATILLKIRGVGELQKEAGRNPAAFDPEKWWEATRRTITEHWPSQFRYHKTTWNEIRAIALKSPDGAFVEFIVEST